LYEEFLDGLDAATERKMIRAVERLATHGPPANPQKCRALRGYTNLWELKEYQSRVFWFYSLEALSDERKVIVLTHGFTKKRNKTPREQLERAEALKREYHTTFLQGSR
jgi:phage-related protein